MRTLEQSESACVAGGGNEEDAADRALTVCNMNNLPDDTKVEITTSTAGSAGGLGTFTSTETTITTTTTCGDLRDTAAKETKQEGA